VLPALLREAGARVEAMAERAPQPPRRRIPGQAPAIERPASDLRRCVHAPAIAAHALLWEPATQTVFGEGPHDAA
jgi:DNA polymerase